jgi:hypothetical protein
LQVDEEGDREIEWKMNQAEVASFSGVAVVMKAGCGQVNRRLVKKDVVLLASGGSDGWWPE